MDSLKPLHNAVYEVENNELTRRSLTFKELLANDSKGLEVVGVCSNNAEDAFASGSLSGWKKRNREAQRYFEDNLHNLFQGNLCCLPLHIVQVLTTTLTPSGRRIGIYLTVAESWHTMLSIDVQLGMFLSDPGLLIAERQALSPLKAQPCIEVGNVFDCLSICRVLEEALYFGQVLIRLPNGAC